MSKFLRYLTFLLLIIVVVGCSQTEKIEKPAGKQEEKSEIVEDLKDEDIINHIIGLWYISYISGNMQEIISFEKDNNIIVMHSKRYSLDGVIWENQWEVQIKDILNNKIQFEISGVDEKAKELTITVNDRQNIELEGYIQSTELKRLVTVDNPEYQDMTSQLIGNWIDEKYVDFNIYKEDDLLIIDVIGEEAEDQYDWALSKFEVYGNVDNSILVSLVEQNGYAVKDYNPNLDFKGLLVLKDDGRLHIEGTDHTLTKSQTIKGIGDTVLKELSKNYGAFVDAVNNFTHYDDVWNANTGERNVNFYAYSSDAHNDAYVIASQELGKSESDMENLAILVDNYTEAKFEGKVWKTPESKNHWVDKHIIIEKINQNTILVSIDNQEITLTK